jgi:hypothetical protein
MLSGYIRNKALLMKWLVVALLLINTQDAAAQKDALFADGGMSLARGLPGMSATYNYNIARFLGLGIGAQLYDYHATMTNFQYVPALFWDVRFTLRTRKKNQYFLFVDAGANIYKRSNEAWKQGNTRYIVQDDNGSYTGLGVGYFRRHTERGRGRYVTLKFISNSYKASSYNIVSSESGVVTLGRGTIVASFGYRF